MSTSIEQLISNLQNAHGLYERLLPILEREREAALSPDVSRLMAATAEKETLLSQLKVTDKQRTRLINHMADEFHLSLNETTIETLVAHSNDPYASQLQNLHASLKSLLARIRRANAQSNLVLRHCLDLVQNSLAFLNHWMRPAAIYGATGYLDDKAAGGCLLSGNI